MDKNNILAQTDYKIFKKIKKIWWHRQQDASKLKELLHLVVLNYG